MCDHKWMVFSTALADTCLMLKCSRCGVFGTVDNPTEDEWDAGFYSPSKPYRWHENDRVKIA